MANILFICNYPVTQPSCGGIIRVTGTLAEIFSKHRHKCYLAYFQNPPDKYVQCPFFQSEIQLDYEAHKTDFQLSGFIKLNQIDVLILQVPLNNSNWHLLPLIRKIIDTQCPTCLFIHCFHSIPFAECKGFDISYFRYMIRNGFSIKSILWGLICIFLPTFAYNRTVKRYERICHYCSHLVLLSDRYLPFFKSHVNLENCIILAIGNPLTYIKSALQIEQTLRQKEKKVIIVGRLDESTKRLSRAIKIWSIIEKKYGIQEWQLDIIGEGQDLAYYQKLVKKSDCKNIVFVGKQIPDAFYLKSSIIISTSAVEGFSMVIVEAKQKGCIPVAFRSFEAIDDVINSSIDGITIKDGELDKFAASLYELMNSDTERHRLATNCITEDSQFSWDTIYDKWANMFENKM